MTASPDECAVGVVPSKPRVTPNVGDALSSVIRSFSVPIRTGAFTVTPVALTSVMVGVVEDATGAAKVVLPGEKSNKPRSPAAVVLNSFVLSVVRW